MLTSFIIMVKFGQIPGLLRYYAMVLHCAFHWVVAVLCCALLCCIALLPCSVALLCFWRGGGAKSSRWLAAPSHRSLKVHNVKCVYFLHAIHSEHSVQKCVHILHSVHSAHCIMTTNQHWQLLSPLTQSAQCKVCAHSTRSTQWTRCTM